MDLEQDGSCSVNCFDAGMGKCVLTMLCSAKGLLSDRFVLENYNFWTKMGNFRDCCKTETFSRRKIVKFTVCSVYPPLTVNPQRQPAQVQA